MDSQSCLCKSKQGPDVSVDWLGTTARIDRNRFLMWTFPAHRQWEFYSKTGNAAGNLSRDFGLPNARTIISLKGIKHSLYFSQGHDNLSTPCCMTTAHKSFWCGNPRAHLGERGWLLIIADTHGKFWNWNSTVAKPEGVQVWGFGLGSSREKYAPHPPLIWQVFAVAMILDDGIREGGRQLSFLSVFWMNRHRFRGWITWGAFKWSSLSLHS